mmetsp:Transcript_11218/g.33661  ORF Transcript_11218/g.33661 Transcript_11218/m.33661 type:complete len:597 (+) Transcript_11218:380-2170(+)
MLRATNLQRPTHFGDAIGGGLVQHLGTPSGGYTPRCRHPAAAFRHTHSINCTVSKVAGLTTPAAMDSARSAASLSSAQQSLPETASAAPETMIPDDYQRDDHPIEPREGRLSLKRGELQRKLVQCITSDEILQVVEEHGSEFFHTRLVSAAFNKIVKRIPHRRIFVVRKLQKRREFKLLLQLARTSVHKMGGQSLSVIAWALAELQCRDHHLLSRIGDRACVLIKFGQRAISSSEMGRLLYGLGAACKKSGGRPSRHPLVFRCAAERLLDEEDELRHCTTMELTSFVHTFGTHFRFHDKPGLAADPLYVDLLDAMMDEVESRAHNLGPTYLEAKETTIPVGCDLGRVLDGLGLAREGGAPSHRLRSGGRLYSLLLPVLAEVVYDLNDLRFCRVLSGLSRLQWTPGRDVKGMLCEQYCIMLNDPQGIGAATYSRGYGARDQVATAIKHLSQVAGPLPDEVLQLTEQRMLDLGVDKGHPRQMRMVLGAFAQHAYLPSLRFQQYCSDNHKRWYNSILLKHGHNISWRIPIPRAPPAQAQDAHSTSSDPQELDEEARSQHSPPSADPLLKRPEPKVPVERFQGFKPARGPMHRYGSRPGR